MGRLAIHIAAILLVIGLSQARTSGRDLSKATSVLQGESKPETETPQLDDAEDLSKKEESPKEEDRMPILPPIILLDFGNGTEEENTTSEEKSKRTVNDGLGYGLGKNSRQPRRYNYYFPAGKSGTTVSIEESISPFLPKTIIERVLPTNQRGYVGTQQNSFASPFSQSKTQSQQDFRHPSLQQSAKSQSTFGVRTKLQKTPGASNFGSYQRFLAKPQVGSLRIQNSGYRGSGATTTQAPLAFSSTEPVRYVTPNPVDVASSQSGFNYVTPAPLLASAKKQSYASQRQHVRDDNINSNNFGSLSQSVETSAVGPSNYNSRFASSSSASDPRYTLESGLRYEKKTFWKYPDGRVSDVPPATFVETYSDYAQQGTKPQGLDPIYETSTTENSVLSQGPVQFPTVSEQDIQEPNPFVSSESLSSSLPQQQAFRLGYQNLVSQRPNVNLAQQRKPTSNLATSYSFSSLPSLGGRKPTSTGQQVSYPPYQQTVSKYMVDSPNPEYSESYTTEATVINNTTPINFFGLGESSSKYTPKTQSYLDTIPGVEGSNKQSFNSNDLNSYSNLQYSDLLSYNPSISEYIRNPSSILNVRPTFIQAGHSLIPVIILRVDGVAPIQTKSMPNINLKALLQQYLIQYANSIQELAQPSTYNLGADVATRDQSPGLSRSPVLDLIRLTQEDARGTPSYTANSYIGRSSYEASNLDELKDYSVSHYGERSTNRGKVKNVQIVDDPRFTTYRV